ncbi:uracil-DNA glycosylase [Candidatus Sumerlaeota bacterium]|nr:uracil-DNA glycosylase [Candidatus Sumerlaeota bacterium]MBI3736474.1 uracil-DNA glycosylase [Candidatus Sumerlaeota bacterium]
MGTQSQCDDVRRQIISCRKCPRLVQWREAAGASPPKRFTGHNYHARGVPGFGQASARLLIIGLAPAAHGANRTGRMFTGDRSGDWLYRALYRAGFANQAESISADDGLELRDAYITAACRCAPPNNKPTPEEFAACSGYLDRELDWLWPRLRVIVVLGALAYKAALGALERRGIPPPHPIPKFTHGGRLELENRSPTILMSYHPSQQNTFTGVLTEKMFDSIWNEAADLISPR